MTETRHPELAEGSPEVQSKGWWGNRGR